MKKLFLIGLAFSLSFSLTEAQTGPGGIGNSDGSNGKPRNILWLDASSLGLSDGASVQTWTDLSGNSQVVEQSNVSNRPTYSLNQVNGKPIISFSETNQNFLLFDGSMLVGTDFDVFYVAARKDNAENFVIAGTTGSSNQNLHFGWRNSSQITCNHWGNDIYGNLNGTGGSGYIGDGDTSDDYGIFENRLASSEGNPPRRLFQNGSQIGSVNNSNFLSSYAGAAIARKYNGTQYSDINVAEVIFYTTALNSAQRTIVNNYLASKYAISLPAGNLYSNSNYQTNLTAIGQDSGDSQSESSSSGFYINDNGGLDNGDFVFFAHDGTNNDTPSVSDLPGGTEERWARDWYVEKTGSLDVNITFDLPEGISGEYPSDVANYVLLYRAGTSGNYSTVTATVAYGDNDQVQFSVSDVNLLNGYYTLGTINATDSPVEGKPGLTWYTLASGNWTDDEIWTLDPSGALPNNPSNQYPNDASHKVVIKGGKTVTVDLNNLNCADLTVEGRLNVGTTTGHNFLAIKGDGRMFLEADNFPSGDATHFITKGQGEGTVIYNGTDYTITNSREFYNVEIELAASSNVITLLNDFSVNGNLTIKRGKLRINDNSSTSILNLSVDGDVDVQANAGITVGQGNTIGSYAIGGTLPSVGEYHNIFHQFTVAGSFTNRGVVKLTNQNAPVYNQFTSSGAVTMRFEGTTNEQFYCYNTTDLYNLIIDKGVDRTYTLELYADNNAYFRLFGPNIVGRNTGSPYSAADPEVRKALWIYQGTLKLTGSVYIPTLSEGSSGGGNGDYAIGYKAKLWMSGADVVVYTTAYNADDIPGFTTSDTHTAVGVNTSGSNSALSLYGEFQISDGYFDTGNSFGFVFWDSANPTAIIDGGEVVVEKLYQVGTGTATYKQTGGKLTKNGGDHFDLSNSNSVFQMSGGEIEVQTGQFLIGSDEGNYNVTGGTVRIKQNGGQTPIVNTTAPLYNFIIERLNGSGTTTVDLQSELVVLNDLTINANTFLDHNGNNVSIGRNMSIDENAAQIGTNNYGYLYDTSQQNTTTFNGTEDGEIYIGFSVPNNGYELYFYNMVVNKPEGKSLTLKGDLQKTAQYQQDNGYAHHQCRLIYVKNDFTVESGIFNQGEHSIRLFGPLTVKATGQCGEYIPGTTHLYALIMLKDADLNITTEEGAVFGNIKVNPGTQTDNMSFSSNVYIKRISYFHGSFDLGIYNLKVDYLHDELTTDNFPISDGDVSTQMFFTSGNASDGGLSILIPEGTANGTKFGYPVGVPGKYTPSWVKVGNVPAGGGYIQINPVQGELQTTNQSGGDLLNYYWRVRHSDFATSPDVEFKFEYDDSDIIGNEADYYPGSVLANSPYTRAYINNLGEVNEANNAIFYDDGSGGRFTLDNANYTAGVANRFTGDVNIYYSKASSISSCSWNSGSSWTRTDLLNPSYGNHDSRQPSAGSYPQEGDVAVIGWCPWNDGNSNIDAGDPQLIRLTASIECAELVFTPMEDVSGNPREREPRYASVFRPCLGIYNGVNLTTGLVKGEGMFWCKDSDPDFSLMDLGEFAVSDSSYILYENYNNNNTYVNIPAESPNIVFTTSGWGNNNYTTIIATDIRTNGNLEILGDANLQLDTDADGDIVVGRNIEIYEVTDPDSGTPSGGGGEIRFQNSGTARTITVGGDIILNNTASAIYVENAGASNISHQMIVGGSIVQSLAGNGLLFSTGATNDHIDLTLNGTDDASIDITSGSMPDFHRLIINKGVDTTATVSINNDFSLGSATSGAGVDKALEIQNGKLILNHTDININLTTGDDYFSIPSTASLEVAQGTVTASGNSGISLDGKLKVSGGTVDMSGGNNPIVYTASGSAAIEVTSGVLTVGSQVRRKTNTDEGILSFKQSGGTVIVGETSAPEGERGVLEILGTGSHFEHTGGTLQIANGQSGATVASLYLNPETSSIGNGTTITFDPVQSSGINEIGIYSTVPFQNVILKNDANLTVKQWIVPMSVDGSFEIEANATFNANGQDLNIAGNYTTAGSFIHGNNTTTFTGSSDQTINGDVTFYNLTKEGATALSLNSGNTEITVENVLDFQAGTLNDNSNNLQVSGNCNFAGVHNYGGLGKGIFLNGTSNQEFSGAGTIAMLTVNNIQGVDIPLGNEFTITEKLRLEAGILNIDKNLLLLTENCIIEHGADDFSATNMIQNNISFTDNGVRKVFPQVTGGVDPVYNFTFPMGSGGKYTPVSLAVSNNDNNSGSLTVKPANEYHPSVLDANNVLHYHWELTSSGISGFESEARMMYEPADVNGNIANYLTARLLSDGTGDWNKFSGEAVIDEASNELVFNFYGTNDAGISGAYTAGTDAAIPNQVPGYISVSAGNWDDENIWDTYPTGGGTVPAGGPRGSIVYVSHDVTVTNNFLSVYRTTINSSGILNLGSTFGHRVGDVSGTGKLKLSDQGSLPAGVYSSFFGSSGGTIEFAGSTDYDLLSSVYSLNNLILSGTGDRRFANVDLTVLGDFTINGANAVNEYDKNIDLKGDLTFTSGAFDSGTGSSTVSFTGSSLQNIYGPGLFTGTNSFNNFTINNTGNINVNTSIDVDNTLNLTAGIITVIAPSNLTVTNNLENAVLGGGDNSHVEGYLTKKINNGGQFDFPVGASGRFGEVRVFATQTTGAQNWKAKYNNTNPNADGFDPTSLDGDLEHVSQNEYWSIEAPVSGNSAKVLLNWDSSSGITADGNLRLVRWTDLATDAWSEVASTNLSGDNSSGSIEMSSVLSFGFNGADNNHYLSFGTISIPAFTWVGTSNDWYLASNWAGGVVPSGATDITIDPSGNNPVIDPANGASVAQVNNLTISAGASLTLQPGSKFTVNGNLVTNDALFINNEVSNPASLITNGTVTGEANVNWAGLEDSHWWHIAHTVTGVTASEYGTSFGGNSNYAVNRYNAGWDRVAGKDNVYSDNYSFSDPLEGYSLYIRNPGMELDYSGVVNHQSTYSKTNLADGWHKIANPYPSYIDVEHIGFNMGDFLKTVFIDGHDDVIATYNLESNIGVNGGIRYIAPGQSVWLRTYTTSNFSISSSTRLHSAGSLKSSSAVRDNKILRLQLESNVSSDETVIVFGSQGSEIITSRDSEKMMNGGEVANLYSVKEAKAMVINILPEELDGRVIPLGYKVSSKGMQDFTFKFTNIESFLPEIKVYLIDKANDEIIDVREQTEYTFTPQTTNTDDRFELLLEGEGVVTSIDTSNENKKENITVFTVNNKATVIVSSEILNIKDKSIEVYDLSGKLISIHDINTETTKFNLPDSYIMYIIKVVAGKKSYYQKVISQ